MFWEEGVYEFRYHLDGKHDVAYISEPFEIKSVDIDVPGDISEAGEFSKQLKTEILIRLLILNQSMNLLHQLQIKLIMLLRFTNCLVH